MSLRYTLLSTKSKPIPKEIQEKIDSGKPIPQNDGIQRDNIQRVRTQACPDLARWFGDQLRDVLERVDVTVLRRIEEIRIRVGKPLLLLGTGEEYFISAQGLVVSPEKAYQVSREELLQTLERMTQSSIYAAEEEMKQGFLTLPGGHRVGITGEALIKNGEIQTLKHVSALNVRIAREIQGKALEILPMLLKSDGTLYHTLILSPPRAGKTSLLRDLIRNLSDGNSVLKLRGQTVGVVDERGELAGMWQGIPAFNLGLRTDVIDRCPKRVGISMLVRAMSPSVVAVDELGHPQDVEAVMDAVRTGVSVLSTAHAAQLEEAIGRPSLKGLFENQVFERIVLLGRRHGPGTIESIFDLRNQKELFRSKNNKLHP